jgi:hypothetical protein
MKTRYVIKNLKKASFLGALLFCAMFVSAAETLVETTVFADDFSDEVSLSGGTPATTYSIFKETISGTVATDPSYSSSSLRIPGPASSIGRVGVFGTLSNYAAPFGAKLSEMQIDSETEVDSVVWTFNMRANVGTTSGFNDGAFGIATILLASSGDYTSANGYAVVNSNVNPPSSTRSFRLVKFTGGLNADSKITNIVTGIVSGANTYPSFRVTFVKSTNTWILYGRLDGSFTDPAQGTFTHVASVVDDTYTNTAMSHFGFLMNYKSYSGGVNMFAFNYKVRTYHIDVLQSNKDMQANTSLFKTRMLPGAVEIETASAIATLYDVTGKVQHTVVIDGKGTIKTQNKGLYLLKVALADGRSGVEKIFIP